MLRISGLSQVGEFVEERENKTDSALTDEKNAITLKTSQ
jgi:hypothetical protein